jgi:hypothetical protein
MEEEDAVFPDDEQAIRDRIDDELVNHALMERVPELQECGDRADRNNKSGSRRRELPQRWGRT